MPDTKPCVFCGKTNDFLMTCEGVCLPCGDKLQAEHGLIIMSLASYRTVKAENERLRELLRRGAGDDCLCKLRHAQGVKGKCWRCDARAMLEEVPGV